MIQLDARAHSEAVRNRAHFYIRPGVYKLHEDSKFELPSAPVGGFDSASTPLFFGAYSYAWSTLSSLNFSKRPVHLGCESPISCFMRTT
jgi:hypothetical protein